MLKTELKEKIILFQILLKQMDRLFELQLRKMYRLNQIESDRNSLGFDE
jgi:hypothetical protein